MNDEARNQQADASPQSETGENRNGFQRTRPHRGSADTDAFLRAVVRAGASDLHLKSGQPGRLRVGGQLRKIDREPGPTEEFEARVFEFLTEEEREELLAEGSVDFA